MSEAIITRLTPASTLRDDAWLEVREPLDRQLSPLGLRAIAALGPRCGERILDVGCGTSQTIGQLVHAVGPAGAIVGIDIAPRLLAIARDRTAKYPNVAFIEGDAQIYPLKQASFDAVFSRFGVLNFDDVVEAFGNLRKALKPDGRLAFVCWRSFVENELDFLPARAAGLESLVDLAPFAFEDPARIREVLDAAGFGMITIEQHDQYVGSGDLDAMVSVVTKVGSLGKILRENPTFRGEVEPSVRLALTAAGRSADITLKAATWIVTARA